MNMDQARASVGKRVTYTAPHGLVEHGVISSVNDQWVFVRYDERQTSQATAAAALELADD